MNGRRAQDDAGGQHERAESRRGQHTPDANGRVHPDPLQRTALPVELPFGRRRGAPDQKTLGQRLHRFLAPMPKPKPPIDPALMKH